MATMTKERITREENYVQYGRAFDMDDIEEGFITHPMERLRHCLDVTLRHKGKLPESYGYAFAREPETGHLVYLGNITYRTGSGNIPTLKERLEESGYRNAFILDDETLLSIARERCS